MFIPGVNDHEIPLIAERAGKLGADIMNILPLIPQADFAHLVRPSHAEIARMREQCRPFIKQMTHCKQCRADACGTWARTRTWSWMCRCLHRRGLQ